jgi:hypothetical protein
MPKRRSPATTRVLIVLLPVVVGSLLGTVTSLITAYYTTKSQEVQAQIKQDAADREAKKTEEKRNKEDAANQCLQLMQVLLASSTTQNLKDVEAINHVFLKLDVDITTHFSGLERTF